MRIGNKTAPAGGGHRVGEIVDNDPLGVDQPATEPDYTVIRTVTPAPDPGSTLALIPQLQTIVPSEFFKPDGSDAVIAALEIEVRKQAAELDISTPERRAAIKSLEYKIARTKTGLDRARKDLVADKKAEVKAIDNEGGRIWDRLEALQKEVLAPLTEWEQANKARVDAHEAAILQVEQLGDAAADVGVPVLGQRIAAVRLAAGRDWQEFSVRADRAVSLALAKLGAALQVAEQAEADAAELRRLRAEQKEREQAAERQRIADEAAKAERERLEAVEAERAQERENERLRLEREQAERDAAAKAEIEQVRLERERVAREAREQAERDQAERERLQAEQAERDRAAAEALERAQQEIRDTEARRAREAIEAEERLEREREESARREREARERAEQATQDAVDAERRRLEAEQAERDRLQTEQREREARQAEQARAERERLEKNKKHRTSIELQAAHAIAGILQSYPTSLLGVNEAAEAIVKAISEGRVPNVSITYAGGTR